MGGTLLHLYQDPDIAPNTNVPLLYFSKSCDPLLSYLLSPTLHSFSPLFTPFSPFFFFTTNLNDTSFFIFNFPFSTTTAKKEDLQTQKQLWIFSTKLTLTQIPNTHTHIENENERNTLQ